MGLLEYACPFCMLMYGMTACRGHASAVPDSTGQPEGVRVVTDVVRIMELRILVIWCREAQLGLQSVDPRHFCVCNNDLETLQTSDCRASSEHCHRVEVTSRDGTDGKDKSLVEDQGYSTG